MDTQPMIRGKDFFFLNEEKNGKCSCPDSEIY